MSLSSLHAGVRSIPQSIVIATAALATTSLTIGAGVGAAAQMSGIDDGDAPFRLTAGEATNSLGLGAAAAVGAGALTTLAMVATRGRASSPWAAATTRDALQLTAGMAGVYGVSAGTGALGYNLVA